MSKYLLLTAIASSLAFNTLYNPKSILGLALVLTGILLVNILKKTTQNTILYSLVLGFLSFSWISYFFSQTGNLGLPEMTLESIIWILFLFLIQTKNQKTKPILIGLIIFALLESLFGIGQFFLRDENRVAGSFFSWYNKAEYFPNALGLFFLFTIPLVHILKTNWIRNLILTITTLCLLLSFSRGALAIYIIQTTILLAIYFKEKQPKIALQTILSLTCSFILFLSLNQLKPSNQITPLAQKYTFSGSEKITSVNERAQFMTKSFSLIKKNPLLGTGPDSFSQVYPSVQPLFLANAPHPHNWILKIAVERGILTTLFFISLIFYSLYQIYLNKHLFKDNEWTILLIAISGGILHNLMDFNLNFTSNYLIFITLLSLIYQKFNLTENKNKRNYNLILLILIVIIAFNFGLKEIMLRSDNQEILKNLNYKNSNYSNENLYQQQIKINKFDAIALNHLGNLANTRQEKLSYYRQAITIDPMNNWIYYANYYNLANQKTILNDEIKILELLKQYLELAKQNIHYTAQHDNIVQAQKVANLFYRATNKSEFYNIQTDLNLAQKAFSSR